MDTLERQVEVTQAKLDEYKRLCAALQKENSSLAGQVKSLKALVPKDAKVKLETGNDDDDADSAIDIKAEPMDAGK